MSTGTTWRRLRRTGLVAALLPPVRVLACAPAAALAAWRWRGGSPLDLDFYASQAAGPTSGWAPSALRYAGRRGALAHYLLAGRRDGFTPHPLLEPAWGAPRTWRRPFPEPLLAPGSSHPALAAVVDAAGLADADTVAVVLRGPRARYGDLRGAAVSALALRHRQEALRLLPRVQPTWSDAALPAHSPDLPSVTVVMPVMNRPAQVVEAIASVQAQTHPSWQLVVVDDGSTDTTPDVVAEVAARDPRVQLVRADHGGVSAARNLGAARATGEVLAWLDSDNTWAPTYLATMLGELRRTGAESAYAVLEQRTDHGVRYRALDAGLEALRLQNHVDLNVLVARRAAVEAVGGFDTSLRRAVDYDLVLRLAAREVPTFVPVVGAGYDERREGSDRITVRESRTWSDVVRARRLVDWSVLAVAKRVPGRVTAVLHVTRAAPLDRTARTVVAALQGAKGDVELVVVDAGGSRAVACSLAVLAATDPRLTVLRWPAPMTPGWALAHALPHVTGEVVAVLDAELNGGPTAGWDGDARALADGAVLAPHLLAARTADVVAVGGADPLHADDAWRADLVERLAARREIPAT